MTNSISLIKYLINYDSDVALMIGEKVTKIREQVETRKYHIQNFKTKHNNYNFYSINILSCVFSQIATKIEKGIIKEKRLGYTGPWTRLIERPKKIIQLYERDRYIYYWGLGLLPPHVRPRALVG